MHTLDETSCAKGKPLRSLWTADEARMVKHILNNLTVKQWNLPSTEVERDLSGDWTIWIPEGGTSSSEDVAGTPAMYKVVIILGWKKTSAEASWEQMTAEEVVSNPPTKMWDEFIPYDEETGEGDKYPWYAFRPTWDYPRTHA